MAPWKGIALDTIFGVLCMIVDPMVTNAQLPLMLVRSMAIALFIWLVARYVLDANPLAWPLAIFLGATLLSASSLLENHRPDLIANGVALIAFAVAALAWFGSARDSHA